MGKTARQDKMARRRKVNQTVFKKSSSRRRPGVFYAPVKKANRQPLRNLEQEPYPAIVAYSETKCRQMLIAHKVLPSRLDLKGRPCYKCNGKMVLKGETGSEYLQCTTKSCRATIRHPFEAYTPLWSSARRSKGMTCQDLVRSAYGVGVRTPQDSLRHYTGLGYKAVQRVCGDISTAIAYTEYKDGSDLIFDNGEVDLDTAAVGADRRVAGETTFKGRLAVYKDRRTKAIAWSALPDKTAVKGKRNLGPESFEEMQPSYLKHMRDGAIHMSDGSPAVLKCARLAGLPAGSVVHSKQEYVRPVKIPLSKLSPKAKSAASKRSSQCSPRFYHTLAGDEAAEGWFGTCLGLRNRMNKHGRASNSNAHINQLEASFLAVRPGLASVLRALRVYREYAQGAMSPADAVGLKKKTDWLFKDEVTM